MGSVKVKAKTVAMKEHKGSSVARGVRMRYAVYSGRKDKTYTGLKKSDLKISKKGKIVSKKMSVASKKHFKGSKLEAWGKACTAARKELNLVGFVAMDSTPQGRALYEDQGHLHRYSLMGYVCSSFPT